MNTDTKTLECDFIDGNTNEAVYKIARQYGVTEIRVPQGTVVRCREDRHRTMYDSAPRLDRELPGIMLAEDAIVIPFEDLAATLLQRAEPAKLAQALWQKSPEVREAFMYAMTSHWSDGSITDEERRRFIFEVKEDINTVAIERHVKFFSDLESKIRERWRSFDVWNNVQNWWQGLIIRLRQQHGDDFVEAVERIAGHAPFLGPDPEYAQYKVVGIEWADAREFWRKWATDHFALARALPMESAPRDKPILAWCDHEADPVTTDGGKTLTLYAAHAEGMDHAPTGWHIIEWGGGWDDGENGWMPDWWFVAGSEFEKAANPVAWYPLPDKEK